MSSYDNGNLSSQGATLDQSIHKQARRQKKYSCLNKGALGNPDLVSRIEAIVDCEVSEAIDETLKDDFFRANLSRNITEQVMSQLRLADQWNGADDANRSYEDIVGCLGGERFHDAIREDVTSALWAATHISIRLEYGLLLAHSVNTPRKGRAANLG
jgi:hypothetical protein